MKPPSWIWIVLIIGILVAPEAVRAFFSELVSGFQTAFGGLF